MIFVIVNGKFTGQSFFSKSNVSNELIYEKYFDNNFDKLNINVDSSIIEIKNTTKDNAYIKIYGNKKYIKKYDINLSNELNINLVNKSCFFFCFNIEESKVIVYLPNNYDKSININSSYSDVLIENFENANVTANIDSGDITLKNAKKVDIKSDYGDINIGKVKKLNIECDSGDINVADVNKVVIENDYGDINIDNISGYMNLENDSGDIKLNNVLLTKSSYINSDYGDVIIKNIKNVYVDSKTDLGDNNIKNNDRKGDIVLTIKNDCGDINVN